LKKIDKNKKTYKGNKNDNDKTPQNAQYPTTCVYQSDVHPMIVQHVSELCPCAWRWRWVYGGKSKSSPLRIPIQIFLSKWGRHQRLLKGT